MYHVASTSLKTSHCLAFAYTSASSEMGFFLLALHIAFLIVLVWVLLKLSCVCRSRAKHIVSLQGKHVVITGGSSGIGFALAKVCLSQGASVTLIARNPDRLSHAARILSSSLNPPPASPHDRILLKAVDVCDAAAVSAAIVESFNWKPIDILICNAGTAIHNALDSMKVKDLDLVTRTNLLGCVYPVHAALPLMKARSKHHPSSIVLMSSLAGLLFVCGANVYTPTKHALKGLAEVLRFELMPHDIKVSLVCPGFTETPLLENEDKDVVEAFVRANEILFFDKENAESADEVAAKTMEGVKRGDFLITTWFDGLILRVLGRGFVPAESFLDALIELFLLVPTRLASHVWLLYAKRVIEKQQREEGLVCKTVSSETSS